MGKRKRNAEEAAAAPEEEAGEHGASDAKRKRAAQYHCNYCNADISGTIRFKCAECKDFDLCLTCFSAGAELHPHKSTHPYCVVDSLGFPLFERHWGADEELLLLEGMEMYGVGNWSDVSDHVGTKSAEECKRHFRAVFLQGADGEPVSLLDVSPVEEQPPAASPRGVAGGDDGSLAIVASQPGQASQEGADASLPPTPAGGAAAAAASDKRNRRRAGRRSKQHKAQPKPAPHSEVRQRLPGSDIAGYMPLRGDFDVEHDNDAELLLAEMEFGPDDHPTDRELKLKIVEIYNSKLDERERRKRFVIERGLLDYKRMQRIESRRPREEREVYNKMRVFARFHSPEEHEEFVQGLIEEMRLQQRIAVLQEYRRRGVRTLAEAEEYEQTRKRQALEQQQFRQRQRECANYLREGSSAAAAVGAARSARSARTSARDAAGAGGGGAAEEGGLAALARERGVRVADDGGVVVDGVHLPLAPDALPLDLTDAPGVEQLTEREVQLCSVLRLLPLHYLTIKDAMLRELWRSGFVDRASAQRLVRIDANKSGAVYDFFVSVGWVTAPPAAPPAATAE